MKYCALFFCPHFFDFIFLYFSLLNKTVCVEKLMSTRLPAKTTPAGVAASTTHFRIPDSGFFIQNPD
jgi:hypothetical protein